MVQSMPARHAHLVGPALAALPALAGKLLGRRGQRIRHRGPDVDLAVAVEIDGVLVELRRQELGQPHGAAPGAAQLLARHAVLQHLQRGEEFAAEHVLAPADIGLRRQHADGVVRQLVAAVVGLAAPDRQHDRGLHAELPLDRIERGAVRLEELLALRGEPRDRILSHIIGRRLHELRLLRRPAPAGPAGRGRAAKDRARARASRPRTCRATRRAPAPPATAIAGKSGTRHRRAPARSRRANTSAAKAASRTGRIMPRSVARAGPASPLSPRTTDRAARPAAANRPRRCPRAAHWRAGRSSAPWCGPAAPAGSDAASGRSP